MLKYILVRLGWIFLNLLLIVSALYIISNIAMRQYTLPQHPITSDIDFVSVQYLEYMKKIFTEWDWGISRRREVIWDVFISKVPLTLKINVIAFLFYIPAGFIFGVVSAIKRKSILDKSISVVTLVFSSIPSFIMIFALILVFAYALDLFPSLYPPIDATGKVRQMALVLPIVALSSEALAILTRLVRGELIETLEQDFYLLVKTKGLSQRQAIFRHSLRNILVPVLPVITMTFIYVMGNSFVIERIYNIPGIASWFFASMVSPFFDTYKLSIDTPVIVLICTFYSLISFSFALIVDVVYRLVDPRMQIGSKKATIS